MSTLFEKIANFEHKQILKLQKGSIDQFQKELVSHNSKKQNVIHVACIAGIPETIRFLVDQINNLKGSSDQYINEKDGESYTALQYCIQSCDDGMPEIVELLIQNGADINMKTSTGQTALHMSSNIGQEDVVKLLIKQSQTDINIQNNIGETPIMQSIQEGQFHIFNILIQRKDIQLTIKDNYGYTCVHQSAITKGNSPVYLRVLAQEGADLNALDNAKNTPILLAAQMDFQKYYRTIETLAELGADLECMNEEQNNLKDFILVEEMDKQADYYQIVYQAFLKRNFDLDKQANKLKRQVKQEEKEEQKQEDQDQQQEKQDNQKARNPEWDQKIKELQQKNEKLTQQLQQQQEQLKKAGQPQQQDQILLAVIVPLILIAVYITIQKLF